MQEDSASLESRLEALTRRLASVERRLAALEAGDLPSQASPVAAGTDRSPRSEPSGTTERASGDETDASSGRGWLTAEGIQRFGRTLVVLGGAFLLRAITEAGVVPQTVGTALGLAYAMVWIAMVDRDAGRGRLRSATMYGLAMAAIAFPLLWEATVQFEFLPPVASAIALFAVTGLALIVVARRRLVGLAWVVTLGSAITSLAILIPTKTWSLFSFELLLLALIVTWMGYARGWQSLAWCVGGLLTATILIMTVTMRFADPERVWLLFSPDMLVALQLGWVVAFSATLGYRKLATGEELTPGEIALGVATLVVGLGGAISVTHSTWVSDTPLGIVSVVLATGLYGVAFAFADRRSGRRRSFVFYSSCALLVTLVASSAVLKGPALSATFALAALLTAWIGTRKSRVTLSLHGAVYIVAAAWTGGLVWTGLRAIAAPSVPDAGWITLDVVWTIAVAAVILWLPVATHGRTWGRFHRAPVLTVTAVLSFGLAAIVVTLAGGLVPVTEDGVADPGLLAALRTGVLSAVAVALAWMSRHPRWPEVVWLLYPVLALGAVKLVLDDLRRGRPATLFLSFVLYGAALILAPRIARRRR